MPYRLKDITEVPREVRRIVEEQIDRASGEIDDASLDAPSTVHQVRKRCKKIRAVLRLARGALEKDDTYRVENIRFRDIARDLSVLRDAEVLVETHDAIALCIDNPDVRIDCAAVRGRLIAHRREIAAGANLDERLQGARVKLREGRGRVSEWARRVHNFHNLEAGLKKTYRRGRRVLSRAYESGSAEAFHELRKRVKYHWYACRLLRDIWPREMNARRRELSRLSDLLGAEHDLSVYRATLESEPTWFGRTSRLADILAVVDRQRDALRNEAYPIAVRLYAEKPGQLAGRFRKYWQCRRAEVARIGRAGNEPALDKGDITNKRQPRG